MSAPENPAAFPGPGPRIGTDEVHGFGIYADAVPGMTLRDWFAGQVLSGLLASGTFSNTGPGFEAFIADKAGNIADAMLAERAKGGDA